MTEKLIIKKYPNRRLYDTRVSKYITLSDVRRLVLDGVDFQVTDVRTGEDLTRNILMQIITEQEHGGDSVFSSDTLVRIIRSYKKAHRGLLPDYLQQCLEIYDRQMDMFQKEFTNSLYGNSLEAMTELAERNLEAWRRIQERFFQVAGTLSGESGNKE